MNTSTASQLWLVAGSSLQHVAEIGRTGPNTLVPVSAELLLKNGFQKREQSETVDFILLKTSTPFFSDKHSIDAMQCNNITLQVITSSN